MTILETYPRDVRLSMSVDEAVYFGRQTLQGMRNELNQAAYRTSALVSGRGQPTDALNCHCEECTRALVAHGIPLQRSNGVYLETAAAIVHSFDYSYNISAYLKQAEEQMRGILAGFPTVDIMYLRTKLINGRIDGALYVGTSCCFFGTLAKAANILDEEGVPVDRTGFRNIQDITAEEKSFLSALYCQDNNAYLRSQVDRHHLRIKLQTHVFDSNGNVELPEFSMHNPVERLFGLIRQGETPENNIAAQHVLIIIDDILKARAAQEGGETARVFAKLSTLNFDSIKAIMRTVPSSFANLTPTTMNELFNQDTFHKNLRARYLHLVHASDEDIHRFVKELRAVNRTEREANYDFRYVLSSLQEQTRELTQASIERQMSLDRSNISRFWQMNENAPFEMPFRTIGKSPFTV